MNFTINQSILMPFEKICGEDFFKESNDNNLYFKNDPNSAVCLTDALVQLVVDNVHLTDDKE